MIMKTTEVKKLCKEIAKVNTACWDAICLLEDLFSNKIIEEITGDSENNIKLIEQVVKCYNKIDKNDEGFIGMQLHSSLFQEFDCLTKILADNGAE